MDLIKQEYIDENGDVLCVYRVIELIEALGLSHRQFEKRAGLSNASIQNSCRKKFGLGEKTLRGIIKAYPNVSVKWLLTGDGDMMNGTININNNHMQHSAINSNINIDRATSDVKDKMIEQLTEQLTTERAHNSQLLSDIQKLTMTIIELSKR